MITKFKKLQDIEPQVDNSKWVRNLSSKVLSRQEVNVLGKGLNFAIQHNKKDILSFVASVETVIDNSDQITAADKDQLRQRVVSSVNNVKYNGNVTKEEERIIRNL